MDLFFLMQRFACGRALVQGFVVPFCRALAQSPFAGPCVRALLREPCARTLYKGSCSGLCAIHYIGDYCLCLTSDYCF